jgi:hypothetical protein
MFTHLARGSLAIAVATSANAQVIPTKLAQPALERAYWSCMAVDKKNNLAGVRMDEAQLADCSAISKELQTRSFGGDFGKLHAWTQGRKVAMPAQK